MNKNILDVLRFEKKNGFKFSDIDKDELLEKLLANIGDVNSEIRDDLIYPNLAHLLHDSHFNNEKLSDIAKQLISDKFLTYDMLDVDENSVLRRTFTLLQLVILIFVHNRDDVFSFDLVREMIENILSYFEAEQVLTGYKKEVGWIHSVAHSADVFEHLFKAKEFTEEDAKRAMKLIMDKFLISRHCYICDEDERMTSAIVSLLDRKILSKEFLIQWVEDFDVAECPTEYPETYMFRSNKKNLLRSIYFRILNDDKNKYLIPVLEDKLVVKKAD